MDCLIFQSTLPTRGSDTDDLWGIERYVVAISIHAPHEGERRKPPAAVKPYRVFQSTLPTRGSDRNSSPTWWAHIDFNPRSPRGGATPGGDYKKEDYSGFQSSLPTRGSDRIRD